MFFCRFGVDSFALCWMAVIPMLVLCIWHGFLCFLLDLAWMSVLFVGWHGLLCSFIDLVWIPARFVFVCIFGRFGRDFVALCWMALLSVFFSSGCCIDSCVCFLFL